MIDLHKFLLVAFYFASSLIASFHFTQKPIVVRDLDCELPLSLSCLLCSDEIVHLALLDALSFV